MIITYKIPNGITHINANGFLRQARRSAIRRMFKQLQQDGQAAAKYTPSIREYLSEREQVARDEAARLFGEQVDAGTRYREAQIRYEEMQSPCYACFTRDKEVLAAAKKVVQAARKECNDIRRGIEEAQKLEKRYKEIQVDLDKIFGSGVWDWRDHMARRFNRVD